MEILLCSLSIIIGLIALTFIYHFIGIVALILLGSILLKDNYLQNYHVWRAYTKYLIPLIYLFDDNFKKYLYYADKEYLKERDAYVCK